MVEGFVNDWVRSVRDAVWWLLVWEVRESWPLWLCVWITWMPT